MATPTITTKPHTDDEETLNGPLSVGVIAAICVVSGLAFFGFLAYLVICFSRRKHRSKQPSRRNPDLLDDDTAENTPNIPQHPLEKLSSENQLYHGSETDLNRWYEKTQGKSGVKTETGEIIPPPHAFHITGSRDSWPLVSFGSTPNQSPDLETAQPVLPPAPITVRPVQASIGSFINGNGVKRGHPTGHGVRAEQKSQPIPIPQPQQQPAQMFTFGPHPSMAAQQQKPAGYPYPYPPPLLIRPSPHQVANPPAAARHARQRSQTNVPRYHPATEYQLSTILRSTSQRLRDAQAAGLTASISAAIIAAQQQDASKRQNIGVIGDGRARSGKDRSSILRASAGLRPLSDVPSTPTKAPEPPVQSEANSRTSTITSPLKDGSVCDSTNTSVLNMFSPATPGKQLDSSSDSDQDTGKSLFHSENRLDITAKGLSPSRHHQHQDKRQRLSYSTSNVSVASSSTTIRPDQRTSTAFGKPMHHRNPSSIDDPFTNKGSPAALAQKELAKLNNNIGAIRPLRLSQTKVRSPQRQSAPFTPSFSGHIAGQKMIETGNDNMDINVPSSAPVTQTSFNFPVIPPGTQCIGENTSSLNRRKSKGHKRSHTLGTSHSLLRHSITVVEEESEITQTETLPSSDTSETLKAQAGSSLENSSPLRESSSDNLNRSRSVMTTASRNSYSAMLDVYDMYSSPVSSRSPSRSLSRSPSRYRRCRSASVGSIASVISIQTIRGNTSNLENISPSPSQKSMIRRSSVPPSPDKVTGVSFLLPFNSSERQALTELKLPSELSSTTTHQNIGGPRHPSTTAQRTSVQASIGLLRRMNSVLSTMSVESELSGVSPSPSVNLGNAGKRLSPAKAKNNYLTLGTKRTMPSKRVSELAIKIEARGEQMSPERIPERSPERPPTFVSFKSAHASPQVSPRASTTPKQNAMFNVPLTAAPLSTLTKTMEAAANIVYMELEEEKEYHRQSQTLNSMGLPMGNALGIVPILSPPRSSWAGLRESHQLHTIKSSPTLGRPLGPTSVERREEIKTAAAMTERSVKGEDGQGDIGESALGRRVLREKDSGVDMGDDKLGVKADGERGVKRMNTHQRVETVKAMAAVVRGEKMKEEAKRESLYDEMGFLRPSPRK